MKTPMIDAAIRGGATLKSWSVPVKKKGHTISCELVWPDTAESRRSSEQTHGHRDLISALDAIETNLINLHGRDIIAGAAKGLRSFVLLAPEGGSDAS